MWTEEKIQEYISNSIEENIHLDYKAALALGTSDGKKTEIGKDVSAFANSDGGVIIYGVKEFDAQEKRHLPERIDPINRLQITKEWLEQIIGSNISPRIPNLKIIPVTIGPPNENKVVYVVEIPKGTTAHQAKDKRYYRRYNFESIAMDDWEIKDIINRQQRTIVRIKFLTHLTKRVLRLMLESTSHYKMEFAVVAVNEGNKIVQFVDLYLLTSEEVSNLIYHPKPRKNFDSFEFIFHNEIEHKVKIEDNEYLVNTQRFPILPNTYRRIGEVKISADILRKNLEMEVFLSTEDNTSKYTIKGEDIIEMILDDDDD